MVAYAFSGKERLSPGDQVLILAQTSTAEKTLEQLLNVAENVKKNGRQGISVVNISHGVERTDLEPYFQRMRKRPPRYPGFTLIEWANSRDFNRA